MKYIIGSIATALLVIPVAAFAFTHMDSLLIGTLNSDTLIYRFNDSDHPDVVCYVAQRVVSNGHADPQISCVR